MVYDGRMIAPMRAEITQYGVINLYSGAVVDGVFEGTQGTAVVGVKSGCGHSGEFFVKEVRRVFSEHSVPVGAE